VRPPGSARTGLDVRDDRSRGPGQIDAEHAARAGQIVRADPSVARLDRPAAEDEAERYYRSNAKTESQKAVNDALLKHRSAENLLSRAPILD
jgi:phage/plasmid primase-like uncharacterized protein